MLVIANRSLGPSAELLLSPETAASVLRAIALAAAARAEARWERELVRWLDDRAHAGLAHPSLDVGDIAWTPEHFESQRGFLVDAIERAMAGCEHDKVLRHMRRMIEAYPRDAVQVGRLWQWSEATS